MILLSLGITVITTHRMRLSIRMNNKLNLLNSFAGDVFDPARFVSINWKIRSDEKDRFRHYKNTRFRHLFQKYHILIQSEPKSENVDDESAVRWLPEGSQENQHIKFERRTHTHFVSGSGGVCCHDGTGFAAKIESTDLGIGSYVVLMSKLKWKC